MRVERERERQRQREGGGRERERGGGGVGGGKETQGHRQTDMRSSQQADTYTGRQAVRQEHRQAETGC